MPNASTAKVQRIYHIARKLILRILCTLKAFVLSSALGNFHPLGPKSAPAPRQRPGLAASRTTTRARGAEAGRTGRCSGQQRGECVRQGFDEPSRSRSAHRGAARQRIVGAAGPAPRAAGKRRGRARFDCQPPWALGPSLVGAGYLLHGTPRQLKQLTPL